MASHKRVKDIDYDEDDLYSGDEEDYDNAAGDGLTDEDRHNFSTLTPVVRAELDEAGFQVETKEIEDALWHYFWDVGKSVSYLKNAKQPKTPATKTPPTKEKVKSKFDLAQEDSAKKSGGEFVVPFLITLHAGPQDPERFEAGHAGTSRSTDLCEKTVARLLTSHRPLEDGSPTSRGVTSRATWRATLYLANPTGLHQSC